MGEAEGLDLSNLRRVPGYEDPDLEEMSPEDMDMMMNGMDSMEDMDMMDSMVDMGDMMDMMNGDN